MEQLTEKQTNDLNERVVNYLNATIEVDASYTPHPADNLIFKVKTTYFNKQKMKAALEYIKVILVSIQLNSLTEFKKEPKIILNRIVLLNRKIQLQLSKMENDESAGIDYQNIYSELKSTYDSILITINDDPEKLETYSYIWNHQIYEVIRNYTYKVFNENEPDGNNDSLINFRRLEFQEYFLQFLNSYISYILNCASEENLKNKSLNIELPSVNFKNKHIQKFLKYSRQHVIDIWNENTELQYDIIQEQRKKA